MKNASKYRMFLKALTFSTALIAASASAAPILIYEGGVLTGATAIVIDNKSFNVDFLSGPCSFALRCDNVGFSFKDEQSALKAASALATQVFAGSEFNPVIPGCEFGGDCWFATPYLLSGDKVYAAGFHNAVNMPDRIELMDFGTRTKLDNVTFARWSKEASIPEPSSIALIGFAMAGLGFARRRKL
ncbi:PEP-CTERM sorting domain-containing protein [Massilia sp. UMI-21]|nr:PEP-CTERM sorting domain-containing protein [Massilia sp. UMI-21]